MNSKILLYLSIISLVFFSVSAFAACVAENEKEVEFTHSKDSSFYYVAMDKNFSFKSTSHAIHTYEKGTTRLVFSASSFLKNSNVRSAVNANLYEYNNATRYTKDVELTETTVGEFDAFFIEYTDKTSNEKGRVTVIIGNEYESSKKMYILNFRAKEVRFDEEKEIYLKMVDSFSLSTLEECSSDDDDDDAVDDDDVVDDDAVDDDDDVTDNDDDVTDDGDDVDNDADETNGSTNSENNSNGTQNEPTEPEEFEILGMSGWVVIGAIVLLLLIIGVGVIGLIIISVVVYYFFIRKKK